MKNTVFSHRFVTIYLNNLGIPVFSKRKAQAGKSFIDGTA
jgi:hypothetical protein